MGILKKREGFTLIELLIVMAIIAILIGISLPRFRGMQEQGNLTKAKQELNLLKTAVESYYMSPRADGTNIYPGGAAGVTLTNLCANYLTAQAPVATRTTGPILVEKVLYDPFGATATTEYQFVKTAAPGNYYRIESVGLAAAGYQITAGELASGPGQLTAAERTNADAYVTNAAIVP